MSENALPALDFTGERFTPECTREIWYEHWHRYAFARGLAKGKRVLDAACGEGYGSAMLIEVAQSVVGVDIDAAAIAHARTRYGEQSHLTFIQGDATALDVAPASFDLVVSFETLEHVVAQDELVAGFARAMSDDGVLLISSPDKRTYSDLAGFKNEFHVRELYREELLVLLKTHFPYVRLYGQKLLFQSVLWSLDAAYVTTDFQATVVTQGGFTLSESIDYAPLYYVAICAKSDIDLALPGIALFGDREESVYAHYNHEVRKNMMAGARIAELEAECAALQEKLVRPRDAEASSASPSDDAIP